MRKLFFVRRMVTAWWSGIRAKVVDMIDGIEPEMVDGEEVEEEEDILNEKTLALIPS
jgi:hypothetical protein